MFGKWWGYNSFDIKIHVAVYIFPQENFIQNFHIKPETITKSITKIIYIIYNVYVLVLTIVYFSIFFEQIYLYIMVMHSLLYIEK